MAVPRKRKTLADYLIIALCPLLIMALVGSVAFFLLGLIYHGPWNERLRWVLFWFVVATVLISRIAMEQGSASARTYGILLALATGGLLYRLIGVTLPGWALLGFIWWCTSKLTWDCTLVDESEDASGEGLLQVAGLEQSPPPAEPPGAVPQRPPQKQGWWSRLRGAPESPAARRPHAPGSWVIYFSLLALPTFGFGQAFRSAGDTALRAEGLTLLGIYVAAALGLLLATSFLGLRRYLRQRYLAMPGSMAGEWILLGSLLAGALMLVCLLIPRPEGSRAVARWIENVATNAAQQASRLAPTPGTAGSGAGKRAGTRDKKSSETPKDSGKTGATNPEPETKPDAAAPRDTERNDSESTGEPKPNEAPVAAPKNAQPREEGAPNSGISTNPPPAKLSPKPRDFRWVATVVKLLLYALLLGAAGFGLYRFRRELADTLRQMGIALRDFLASLLGKGRAEPEAPLVAGQTAAAASPRQSRPFSSLANPFTVGGMEQATPAELVTHTFNAMQLWAEERGLGRLPDQTPLEFAGRLDEAIPEIGAEARVVARWYTRVAYAQQQPPQECLEDLARLWDALEVRAAQDRRRR